tara:strand:+ start:1599 stop:2162 length:564 start_codon:yes stop_codon:yes gene_type:complete
MPITINGSGTVSGLSVGGLPDGSIASADLATSINLGKIVAVKRAQLTTKFSCSSTSFQDTGLEITHTAGSSTNLILLNAHIVISGNFWNHAGYYLRLAKDSSTIGSAGSGGSSFNTPIYANFSAHSSGHTQSHGFLNHLQHMEAAGDTSSHTYKVRAANNSNSYPTYYNGTSNSASVAHLVLMEISA